MPLYANINGAKKEIIRLYTNIGGASRGINTMYANINGAQKMIFTSGEKFYTLRPTDGSETWNGSPNGLYYIGWSFLVKPNYGTFELQYYRPDANIRREELYIDQFSQSGSVLKMAKDWSGVGNIIKFYAWKLDFGAAVPDAVGTAYSPNGSGAFINSEDRSMYIRADDVTFYRWREHPNNGGYWYRTFDTTPDGFDASTRTII